MKKTLLIFSILLLVGGGCSKDAPQESVDIDPQDLVTLESSIVVEDHRTAIGNVVVQSVTASQPGWLVLYTAEGNAPGGVVGHAPIAEGENTNTEIEAGLEEDGEYRFFVLVHEDSGDMGTFEFPLADLPAKDSMAELVTVTFQAE